MAYVPGFDWDIFISYPREANERDAHDLEWVDGFCRLLESEIKQRLTSQDDPQIYFDLRNFGVADRLEDNLLDAARKSWLFVPIVSPRYVAPGKFTLLELEAFCEPGDFKNRIVTIDLLPVSIDQGRPSPLHDLKRNNFYSMAGKAPIKLTPQEYARQLQIVAEEIKELLEKKRREVIMKTPFAGKTVLLAEREDDVEHQWDKIRDYLSGFGVNILLGESGANDDDLQAFEANLEQADLFVQLLSPVDEAYRWIEGKSSRAKLRYDLAARRPPRLGILQWRKPGKPDAFKYWDKGLLDSPDVLAVGLEEFKRAIKDKLTAPPPRLHKSRSSAKPYIYITADDDDIPYAQVMKQKAEGEKLASDCEIIASENRMKNFEEAIKISDVIVVLYGHGRRQFVDDWLNFYRKKKVSEAAKLPELDAFCWAPPRKGPMQMPRGPLGSFQLFGSEDKFSADVIRQILEELQRRRDHSGVAAS
jgi:hypothetical protein